MTMAGRISSSVIFRSALAAHASLTVASLISTAISPPSSHMEELSVPLSPSAVSSSSNENNNCSHSHYSNHPKYHQQQNVANMCAGLPWLDQLNDIIANMYINGQIKKCGCSSNERSKLYHNGVTMVQIGQDVSFENPIVSYEGYGEIERAFKGRFRLHPQNDVKTLLECVDIEASNDSIVCGNTADDSGQHSSRKYNRHVASLPNSPLFDMINHSSISSSSSSPPSLKVTYRISQQYGTYFSVHSLLVVTVQLRGCSSEKVRTITPEQQLASLPLATSGFTPRAANIMALVATAHSELLALAFAKATDKAITATRGLEFDRQLVQHAMSDSQPTSFPVVAEVLRIEELWNGVPLLPFIPVHWSRRLNGMIASSAAYIV